MKPEHADQRCECGHIDWNHPVGLSGNIVMDGHCLLCACKQFVLSQPMTPLPSEVRMMPEHTCHDMNPPHPYPCAACDAERLNYFCPTCKQRLIHSGTSLDSEVRTLLETWSRWFPVTPPQTTEQAKRAGPSPLRIPWSVAEKAYSVYAAQYGRNQSLERVAERGGFYATELDDLYPGWREEASEITALRQVLAALDVSCGGTPEPAAHGGTGKAQP